MRYGLLQRAHRLRAVAMKLKLPPPCYTAKLVRSIRSPVAKIQDLIARGLVGR